MDPARGLEDLRSLLEAPSPAVLITNSDKLARETMQEIERLGVRNIFVVDDNFIGNKKEAKALLTALGDWQSTRGYPLEFMTEVSLNVAQDDELLALMKRAHFTTVFVGIESPRRASRSRASRRTRGRTSSPLSTGSRPPASR